jgi:hypothetical protein
MTIREAGAEVSTFASLECRKIFGADTKVLCPRYRYMEWAGLPISRLAKYFPFICSGSLNELADRAAMKLLRIPDCCLQERSL